MKFKAFLKILLHSLCVIILTIVTQIGGIIYIISLLCVSRKKSKHRIKRTLIFTFLYLISTFFIIPKVALIFGRIKIEDNHKIKTHNYFTKICNRDYVTTKMHAVLTDVSLKLNQELPEIKLIYLDANFPFFDGFPLLPHLSHNDGKKIDLSFIYEDENGKTNLKPSKSGYGIFEAPLKGEKNQTKICKQKGSWQYDFTKYLTLGTHSNHLKFSKSGTKILINKILANQNVSKIFIEPHLKVRLHLKNSKIRFHGCNAVRHDDHIHLQIH
jgi:hypothetical protein